MSSKLTLIFCFLGSVAGGEHARLTVVLFGLRLYGQVHNVSVMSGRFPGLDQNKVMQMKCLAQGHKTASLVRFEPATLRSRVRHSTN